MRLELWGPTPTSDLHRQRRSQRDLRSHPERGVVVFYFESFAFSNLTIHQIPSALWKWKETQTLEAPPVDNFAHYLYRRAPPSFE